MFMGSNKHIISCHLLRLANGRFQGGRVLRDDRNRISKRANVAQIGHRLPSTYIYCINFSFYSAFAELHLPSY